MKIMKVMKVSIIKKKTEMIIMTRKTKIITRKMKTTKTTKKMITKHTKLFKKMTKFRLRQKCQIRIIDYLIKY